MPSFLDRPIIGPGARVDVLADAEARGLFGNTLRTRAIGRARRFFGPGEWRQVFAVDASKLAFPARFTVKANKAGARVGVLYDRGQVPGGDAIVTIGATDVEMLTASSPRGLILEVWADDDVDVRPIGSDVIAAALDASGGDAKAAEIAAVLAAAEAQLELLRDERDRILGEAQTMRIVEVVGNVLAGIGSALGLGERADSTIALLEQIDRFVSDVFIAVEKQARAGDLAAAKRLERATRNILAAVRGVSPTEDFDRDVVEAVAGMAEDARGAGKAAAPALVAVAIAVIVVVLAMMYRQQKAGG